MALAVMMTREDALGAAQSWALALPQNILPYGINIPGRTDIGWCNRRLNQDRLRKKQGAKDKLRRLVAPLLGITGAPGSSGGCSLAFKAFSTIRPRISLRFEGIGVTLRDGTVILEGVNGHFRHSKVCMLSVVW